MLGGSLREFAIGRYSVASDLSKYLSDAPRSVASLERTLQCFCLPRERRNIVQLIPTNRNHRSRVGHEQLREVKERVKGPAALTRRRSENLWQSPGARSRMELDRGPSWRTPDVLISDIGMPGGPWSSETERCLAWSSQPRYRSRGRSNRGSSRIGQGRKGEPAACACTMHHYRVTVLAGLRHHYVRI